jgi:hypothetical protein
MYIGRYIEGTRADGRSPNPTLSKARRMETVILTPTTSMVKRKVRSSGAEIETKKKLKWIPRVYFVKHFWPKFTDKT